MATETFSAPITKWGADIVSKTMAVTAASDNTACAAGQPVTIGADGASAVIGNAGGSGKVLGILAEDGTFGTTAVNAKVIYAGTVYAEGILAAQSDAPVAKYASTPGKIVVIDREDIAYYG
jgi:hypothetical protein